MAASSTTATTVPQALHPRASSTTIHTTVVQMVLDRLMQPDALHAAQVCKDWLATVQHHLLRATLRSPAALEHVTTRFANLEHLALHNVHIDNVDFKHIARLKHLQSLTLEGGMTLGELFEVTGLEALASMPTLSHLTLRRMFLTPTSGLAHVVCKAAASQEPCVKNKGALLELTLHACRAEATLGELLLGEPCAEERGRGYSSNRELMERVPPSSRRQDESAMQGGYPPPNACQLQLLDLTHLQTRTPRVFKGLGKVTTLRTLVLKHVGQLDDDACIEVAKLTDLHSLDLTRHSAHDFRTKLSHQGIEALCSLPNLKSLVLQEYAWLSNTTANLLCKLHASLTHLDLRQRPVNPVEWRTRAVVSRKLHSILDFPGDLHAQQHNGQAPAALARDNMPEDTQQQPQQEREEHQQREQQQQVLASLQQLLQEIHQLLQRHEQEGQAKAQQQKRRLEAVLQEVVGPQGVHGAQAHALRIVLEEHNNERHSIKRKQKKDLKSLLRKHKQVLQEMVQKLDHQGKKWVNLEWRRIKEWAHKEQQEQKQGSVWPPWGHLPEDAGILLHMQERKQQEQRERAMFESRYGKFTSASVQRIVKGLPHLQSLVLSGDAVDRDACGAIGHALPALTTLELVHCHALTDGALCLLELLTMLRTLSVVECDVTDTGVTHILEACRLLQHVRLAYTPKVTSLSIQALHGLPLVSLDLAGNMSLNDEVLAMLVTACPLLETLILDDCTYITDTGVCAVATHALQLRHLSLQYCLNITVRGLDALTALPRLACVHAYGYIANTQGLKLPGVEVVLQQPSIWTTWGKELLM